MTERDRMAGTGYWGSVRFFKHLILSCTALMILVPTLLCVVWGLQNQQLRREMTGLHAQLEESLEKQEKGIKPHAEEFPKLPEPETPEYQRVFPDFYALEAALGTVDEEKTVYLTFDDGPSNRTPEILKILDEYGIKATFFVIGKPDEQSQQWMRDIAAAGHTLGLHSYSHDYDKIYASVEAFLTDMEQL